MFQRFQAMLAVALFAAMPLGTFAAVDVASHASRGSGSSADPWLGWDVNIPWEEETEYSFRAGTYAYFASPNFLKTGIALKGEPGTVLRFLGQGNAVVFDNPGTNAVAFKNWTMNVRMENFAIEGTAAATNGIYVRAMRNGIFRNISVRDVTASALRCEACVTNIVDGLRVTPHDVLPSHGIVLAARGTDTSTTLTMTHSEIRGVREAAVEGNAAKGFVFEGPLNTVMDTRMSGNGVSDIEIDQSSNEIHGVASTGLVEVRAGQMNKLRGSYAAVTIFFGCDFTDIVGANIATLADRATNTVRLDSPRVIGEPFIGRTGRGP
jgi:hypothetical protein